MKTDSLKRRKPKKKEKAKNNIFATNKDKYIHK